MTLLRRGKRLNFHLTSIFKVETCVKTYESLVNMNCVCGAMYLDLDETPRGFQVLKRNIFQKRFNPALFSRNYNRKLSGRPKLDFSLL